MIREGTAAVLESAGIEADGLEYPAEGDEGENVGPAGPAVELDSGIGTQHEGRSKDDGGDPNPLLVGEAEEGVVHLLGLGNPEKVGEMGRFAQGGDRVAT